MGEVYIASRGIVIQEPPLGTEGNPAPSGIALRDAGMPTGTYYVETIFGSKLAYVDMDSDGGGWILYASFSTDNQFTQNAITKSRMLVPEFGAYGFSLNYTTNYSDGVNGSLAYTRRSGWFAHFYSGGPSGEFTMTSYQGPNEVTEMKIRHGGGSTSYSGPSGYVTTNNINRGNGASNPTGTTVTVAPFNRSGATPLFRQNETGIAGISDIWVR